MAAKQHIQTNSPKLWQIPPLREADHKYTRGHVLILGGKVMTGASRLAALAAQRVGAGMVTLAMPERVFAIYAASMLSVVVRSMASVKDWQNILASKKISVVLLGPGAEPGELRAPFKAAIKSGLPLVLDAGVLGLLADDETMRALLLSVPAWEERFLVTPHAGEYAKLARAYAIPSLKNPIQQAHALAVAMGATVLLKGAHTYIASPAGRMIHHHAVAPWLATAGTGDVLAGMIAGLAAQGMALTDAAAAGAYLHGKAAEKFGPGMIAEDMIAVLPETLRLR